MTAGVPLKDLAQNHFSAFARELCSTLETLDGKGAFRTAHWPRPGGGGGPTNSYSALAPVP